MARTARASIGGMCYHVITRGIRRQTVFHDDADYSTFLELIRRAQARSPLALLAFCLMPNHVHLVVRSEMDGQLGRWMQWLLTAHVRRHHQRHGTDGRIWQGRFKAFAIQTDDYLVTVLRYVERNALRAGLVSQAEGWRHGSLYWRLTGNPANLLSRSPLPSMAAWCQYVNEPQTAEELEALRRSVNRERPFGEPAWVARVASQLGMESAVRNRGRPRKDPGASASVHDLAEKNQNVPN